MVLDLFCSVYEETQELHGTDAGCEGFCSADNWADSAFSLGRRNGFTGAEPSLIHELTLKKVLAPVPFTAHSLRQHMITQARRMRATTDGNFRRHRVCETSLEQNANVEGFISRCSLKSRRDEPDVPAERLRHEADPPLDQDGDSSWAPGCHGNQRAADGDRSWFLILSRHQTSQPGRPTLQVDEAKEGLKVTGQKTSRKTEFTQKL